ncbi:MAG: FAD dependent oxidoreductase [Planctomycetes bacterium ADurb.Bin126]|nr:MAG: FAD dependent oxidoreductase [Planctomycetes bacterium ADurb.Bin126]
MLSRRSSLALAALAGLTGLFTVGCPAARAVDHPAVDLVIYGNTSAGVAAAVQARRMGKTVVLVGPDRHLGGLSAGGLGQTDSGNKAVIGGVSREFYRRIRKHYDQPSAWTRQKSAQYKGYRPDDDAMWGFEPHVAERVFEDLIREHQVPVRRDEWLDREGGVTRKDGRIVAIRMLSGNVYRGRVFLDATYEGDLMAAAGVDFTVGREPNSKYDETLNAVHTGIKGGGLGHHQFVVGVSAYVRPGDRSSGLLPFIDPTGPGREGEGDHRVQAYNFRMCLSDAPENRVNFAKPEGYDEQWYELLLRNFEAGAKGNKPPKPECITSAGALRVPWINSPMPNRKTDTNNQGGMSTDFIGQNYAYPTASYAERKKIIARHRLYQQGLMYTLATHPRVPEKIRREVARWGLAKDEFTDNGHWPHQIYVREARRMIGEFVVTENHLRRRQQTPRPIGLGSYNMDSHHVQRYVTAEGDVLNEGDIQVNPGGPYPIDYGAILPRKAQCDNLLVPVCVSCSHIAYGSIRMEPVFMILGQSAATAACLAIDNDQAVQDVSYQRLRERLLADGQVLDWPIKE